MTWITLYFWGIIISKVKMTCKTDTYCKIGDTGLRN